MKKIFMSALLSLGLIGTTSVMASYDNVFISYTSPANVASLVNYSQNQNLGGYIIWDLSSDMPYNSADSLLAQITKGYAGKTQPLVMAYWTDWSVYTTERAQTATPYPMPGSYVATNVQTNADMTAKLEGINMLAYAFMEAEPSTGTKPGTLYFYDPWSDLLPAEKSTVQDSFCQTNADTCWYAFTSQGKKADGSMGNFNAFAALNNSTSTLKKVVSIGGYAHDSTFETTFGNPAAENNFVDSTVAVVKAFNLDGIDLDYENPSMTYQQSDDYAALVVALRQALPGKIIMATMLASPAYLQGTVNGNIGFDPKAIGATGKNALQTIAANVDHINLMTYDFHGAFDYSPSTTINNYTGFLSSIALQQAPADPFAQDHQFSIETSVQALQQAASGIQASQVVVGIPSYGRALAGVAEGANSGLFSPLTASSSIVPGDLDQKDCNTALPLGANACSGTFSYKYIVNNLLTSGFTQTVWNQSGFSNGTTAYAASWGPTPGASNTLEVTNTGTATGITVTVSNANASFVSDYLAPSPATGSDKTYTGTTNPSTTSISGQSGLKVTWANWDGTAKPCAGTFDFTGNYHIMINDATGACTVSSMS